MISTNKDSLIKNAVQGEIMPAIVDRHYLTTWDGRPKMAIGIGGINYNLRVGDRIFGWASGDRAEPGVATDGKGKDEWKIGYRNLSCIGNMAMVLEGEGKGGKGIIVGKHSLLPGGAHHVNIQFEEDILEKLAIGEKVQVKAWGVGLKIEGFENVRVTGLDPELLEKLGLEEMNGKLNVPVVKEIPSELIGEGFGGSPVEQGNWDIQTCYPPDIAEYGLNELCFGDIVFLKDVQSDYGRGHYKGGATVGVVSSGPSEISGRGIGVTTILSSRFGKLNPEINSEANISNYLGIKKNPTSYKESISKSNPSRPKPRVTPKVLKTNADKLIVTAIQGVIQPPSVRRGYGTTWDGKSKLVFGMASINYNVSVGDPAYGWAGADHVESDVTIQGRDKENPSDCALAILACIGNEATVVSGDAKGKKGIFTGRHAGSNDKIWLPKEVLEKLALDDKIQIKACGAGLVIEGFEDVKLNKMSPRLLENMGITIQNDQLMVPVTMEIPGFLMGAGIGYDPFTETVDYDIQTTCPEYVEKYGLKKLRIGDIIAIHDHYDVYGRGRYKGAVTIGVIVHGFSDFAGHGPGVNPIMSALPGRIKTILEPQANIAYYLGIRKKPEK